MITRTCIKCLVVDVAIVRFFLVAKVKYVWWSSLSNALDLDNIPYMHVVMITARIKFQNFQLLPFKDLFADFY